MSERRQQAVLLLLAVVFVGTGLLFIPRMGIEVDEALVGAGLYPNSAPWFSVPVGGRELPLMLMSHLGATKTWLYAVLFQFTSPRPLSLRLPTLLIAAGSLWLFFALLDRAVGRRGAWIGTVLLATDTAYVLMNSIDYGPVTLQLTLKLAAWVLLLRFQKSRNCQALAGAFLCLGLAMWDKAIFSWVLCGMFAGALAVFPRQIFVEITWRNLRFAVPAFLAGALPLLIANIARPLDTFRANAHLEQFAVWGKWVVLRNTLDGHVFMKFFFADQPGPQSGAPQHGFRSLSITLSEVLGHPQYSLTFWATLAGILALPFLWRTPARKPILFALVSSFVTWLMMAFTAGAGAAAQHVMLLWPLQFVLLAAALAHVSVRPAVAITAILSLCSLAITNQHYADLLRNGPAIRWTDAMDPLQRSLEDLDAPRIYVADWGLIETMQLLSEGRLPIQMADLSSDESTRGLLEQPDAIFVSHAAGIAIDPHQRATLEAVAQREQYIEEPVTTIVDRNGRPAFDVFRFRKLHL